MEVSMMMDLFSSLEGILIRLTFFLPAQDADFTPDTGRRCFGNLCGYTGIFRLVFRKPFVPKPLPFSSPIVMFYYMWGAGMAAQGGHQHKPSIAPPPEGLIIGFG